MQPEALDPPAHDAFTRLLHRLEPDPETLWREAEPLVDKDDGVLVLDDSTLDKPYARRSTWSPATGRASITAVVRGINLISLVWTDGDRHIPCDYRLYDKANDGLTKNDHFRAMLDAAHERGFRPRLRRSSTAGTAGLDNLKLVRDLGWRLLTQLKVNRRVDLDRRGYQAVRELAIGAGGTIVHLEGFGPIRVFKVVSRDGDIEYWATNDLAMDELTRLELAERCWAIEDYHRALKQCCGVERCQARSARAQRNHIGMAIRAFLRLAWHFYATGVSWYEAKTADRPRSRPGLPRPPPLPDTAYRVSPMAITYVT